MNEHYWIHKQDNALPARTAPPLVHDALRSAGRPLDTGTRAFFEPRFGHDFSQVRVHDDAKAAEAAQAVNALAYTVGSHVVLGAGQRAPSSAAGQRLLAHELTHVVQQAGANTGGQIQGKLAIGQPGDAYEQEADAVAARVVAGVETGGPLLSSGPAIQRETPTGQQKPEEKKDAGEVVAEGMKIVADQAADNNPKVKKVIIEPIKDQLKARWGQLSTGEKVATVSFGVGALGIAGGSLLGDPAGRKQLEGFNLAAPLTLIPYMPLTSFKYVLPSGTEGDKRLFRFETGFDAGDLLNLRTEGRGLPKMSLTAKLEWGYDPVSERLSILGGSAGFGLVPGLSLSAGAYKDVLSTPRTFFGSEGQLVESKKSIPEFAKPEPIPDVRIMLNVDLLKFKPRELVRQIQALF